MSLPDASIRTLNVRRVFPKSRLRGSGGEGRSTAKGWRGGEIRIKGEGQRVEPETVKRPLRSQVKTPSRCFMPKRFSNQVHLQRKA